MKLSDRLEAVIGMVPEGSIVYDVGCDHAFVPIELVLRSISPGAVASDVRPGPLERAEEHIRKYGLSDRIRTVLCDGIPENPLQYGFSFESGRKSPLTLITSGMGGLLMMEIMRRAGNDLRVFDWYIASPQKNPGEFRIFLQNSGFRIEDEAMILEDGKYYPVILSGRTGDSTAGAGTVCGQHKSLPDSDESEECRALYGPLLLARRDPVLISFLRKEKAQLESVLARMEQGGARNQDAVRKRMRLNTLALKETGANDEG